MKQVVPPVLLLVLAALGWWLWAADGEPSGPGQAEPHSPAEPGAQEPVETLVGDPKGVPSRAAPDPAADGEREAAQSETGSPDAEPGRLLVRVRKADGRIDESGSGSLALLLIPGGVGPPRESNTYPVDGGVVHFAPPPQRGDRWRVFSARLDGAEALPLTSGTYPWTYGEDHWIELREITDPWIEVRAADDGTRLGGAKLVLGDGFLPHPGSEPELHWGPGATPHRLDLGRLPEVAHLSRSVDLWVGAEGYAWKSALLRWAALSDPQGPSELPTAIVELARGSRARVSIDEPDLPKQVQLGAVRDGELLFAEDLAGRDSITLDGLPLGELEVQLFEGVWWEEPRVLGSGRGTVVEGEEVQIAIEVERDALAKVESYAVELIFDLAASSERTSLGVHVDREGSNVRTLLDAKSARGSGALRFQCEVGELEAGRWRATIPTLGWSAPFEVREDQTFTFAVPLSKVLRVEVLAADTGLPFEGARVSWAASSPEVSAFDAQWRSVPPAEQPGAFEFKVAQAEVWISVRLGGHPDELHRVEVLRERELLRLSIAAATCLQVEVSLEEDPTAPLPERWGWDWSLVRLSDDRPAGQPILPEEVESSRLRLFVPEPGRYRLVPPSLDGYQAIEPVDVELSAGELRTLPIRLRKKI